MEKLLLKNTALPRSESIDVYLSRGGYKALPKALQYKPAELVAMMKASGLRGRGGAGFPSGLKWGFMPQDPLIQKYVCVNADEGEPGTFKDRELVEKDPHQIIEGTIIACYAVGASRAYAYFRAAFDLSAKRWLKAIDEAYAHGFLGKNILGSGFDVDLSLQRGAGAYICGEETAMLNSLEGKRGEPRLKPPYPAQVGLFASPTLVHNVETLANVPHIVLNGPEWFASIGTKRSPGPKIFCVSGHVKRSGNYELPLGVSLREIIFQHAGGVVDDRDIKAVIPGGTSTPVLTKEHLDVRMDFESLAEVGSALGTGAIIVLHDGTCMVDVARRIMRFYVDESCGRCTPCRVGTLRMLEILERMEGGQGRDDDVETLLVLAKSITGNTFCPLGDAAAIPIRSNIERFREEFDYHVQHKSCMV